jgi:hypothetical protein
MPGKRTDKERAWESLEDMLRLHRMVAHGLAIGRDEPVKFMWQDDEMTSLNKLLFSGRLDSRQIIIIRKLIQAVIRVERNCDPEP